MKSSGEIKKIEIENLIFVLLREGLLLKNKEDTKHLTFLFKEEILSAHLTEEEESEHLHLFSLPLREVAERLLELSEDEQLQQEMISNFIDPQVYGMESLHPSFTAC